MDNKVIIVAAVVAVVVVAAVGAVIIVNNGNESKDTSKSDVRYALQIMGNANEDMTIDGKDLTIIEEINKGTIDAKDYYYADANNDGKVDDKDIQLVKDIIDRKNGTKVFVVNTDSASSDQKQIITEVTYPLTKVVPYGVNIVEPIVCVDGGRCVAAYFAKGYPVQEESMQGVNLEGGSRTIGDKAWKNFTTADADIHFDAFIITYDARAQLLDTYRQDLTDANIPLICYAAADPDGEADAALTLGFLFGGKSEALGKKYAQIYDDVLQKIDDTVKDKTDEQKTVYLAMTMYTSICQNDSTYTLAGQVAGGIPYYKTDAAFAEKYKGTSSTTTKTYEVLSNLKMQKILDYRSMDQVTSADEKKKTIVDTWTYTNSNGIIVEELMKTTTIYENDVYFINNTLPGPVRVALSGAIMYDELTMDWANSIMQQFIDGGFTPFVGKTIGENIVTCFNYQDYLAAKS